MSKSDKELFQIRNQLVRGLSPPTRSVRFLLSLYGAKRRSDKVVDQIQKDLVSNGLVAVPNIDEATIDEDIVFSLDSELSTFVDPIYRVSVLKSASRQPVWISPNASMEKVLTVMLQGKYSQVPVMSGVGPHSLKGVISWETIGSKKLLGAPLERARDCMDESPSVVKSDESLFSTIKKIADREYVLVKANDHTICGIVTASDFSEQFALLAEPFLLIGEIERGIRRLLNGRYTATELTSIKKPGTGRKEEVQSLNDLTFGDYVHLLRNREYWKKSGIVVDRGDFVASLEQVADIRNAVMHFRPHGIDSRDLRVLREFAEFLKNYLV